MSTIDDITMESWVLSTFPEWGTWLNEEIEEETVAPGTAALWWLGCTGLWIKTAGGTQIGVDLWAGSGRRTRKIKTMPAGHLMANMSGGRLIQPNRRAVPVVLNPFAIKDLDAVLATHSHSDHMDPNYAAAVIKNIKKPVPFIGPKKSVELWLSWGVPPERCKTVKPGDSIKAGDLEILALDSFDRSSLVTTGGETDIRGTCPGDMDDRAVNYLIKTSGGNIYHAGDSHYSSYYAKHGKDHTIDVALGSYGENPVGIMDKMTSIDILRMAEALRCRVVIPIHYDTWTNFMADPAEILALYDMRKYRLGYQFTPFIWQPGGKFIYPNDRDKREFHHSRGFEDCFGNEPNLPFRSML